MMIVALAWIYVVLMMALAEALSPQGTVLGAVITLVMYGVLPLAIVLYILGTPGRRRARRVAEQTTSTAAPDGGRQAPGNAVAPEREEP
jgi:mannose/fructose/N-acetylgalactosamine-specific phosphotransferase system component IID